MAERLGNGLQNREQQFESAWYLPEIPSSLGIFLFYPLPVSLPEFIIFVDEI